MYAPNLGPESLPTDYHNWLHGTSDNITTTNTSQDDLLRNIKRRTQKHVTSHKNKLDKGYQSWQPK